jgi:hypothetical protein
MPPLLLMIIVYISFLNLYKAKRISLAYIVPICCAFTLFAALKLAIANRGTLLGVLELRIHHLVAHATRDKLITRFVSMLRWQWHY